MLETLDYQSLNLYDNYAQSAAKYPTTPIIFDEKLPAFPELNLESTYEETLKAIQLRAYQLAQLGVSKGDKVVLYKSPKFDTYMLAVAASYLAAVPVMVSYHLPVATMEVFADRLEQPYILFDDETANRVEKISNLPDANKISVEHLLKQSSPSVAQAYLEKDDISYMTHTSGTTGIPKLICHSANSMGWRTKWQKTVFKKMERIGLMGFHISPVHSRFSIGISSAMALGFPLMPLASAKLDDVRRMFMQYPPLAVETHPNHFVQWVTLAERFPEVFAQTKYYHSTFDAINFRTMRVFLEASKAQNPIFLQVYGQSECGPMIIRAHRLETLGEVSARNMGVGLEDLTKARIADAQGNTLPDGTDGHIQFLSKGRALTYYKEDERFQSTVFNEWWDSGDYGCIDENGHLILKDRQVDLIDAINSNLAIEDFLLDHLDFLSEVVIVRGKENRPQPILAVAEGKEMNWDAWWEKVSDLPRLNEPILMDYDEIPRTATMKVQRLQLEQQLKQD
ncbi:MAG: acyl-CoA synthetase [Aerococcaceae bacterium]|nr:acyl-CoA synthetase [Aerococcaceae bacterium]